MRLNILATLRVGETNQVAQCMLHIGMLSQTCPKLCDTKFGGFTRAYGAPHIFFIISSPMFFLHYLLTNCSLLNDLYVILINFHNIVGNPIFQTKLVQWKVEDSTTKTTTRVIMSRSGIDGCSLKFENLTKGFIAGFRNHNSQSWDKMQIEDFESSEVFSSVSSWHEVLFIQQNHNIRGFFHLSGPNLIALRL